MSSRKSYIGAKRWLALLAIGYLAVGAPLIHPFLHDHHSGPDGHGHPSGMMIQAAIVDASGHDCLICHFLGQNHILAFNPPPTVATDVSVGCSLGNNPVSYDTSPTIPIIPRAPPFSLFFCTAR